MLCYDKNNLQNKQERLNYIYSRDLFIPANQNQRRIRDRRWLKLSVSQIWNSIRPSRAFSACRSDQFECRWSGDHGENIIKDIWNGDGWGSEFMAVACLGQVLLWVTYRLAPRGYYGYYYNFTIALHFSVFFFLISTALLLPRLKVRWSHKSGPKKWLSFVPFEYFISILSRYAQQSSAQKGHGEMRWDAPLDTGW